MFDTNASKPSQNKFFIAPESLGNPTFRQDYGIKYNYLCGGMYKGITSVDMVVALGKAGLMGYFGTGGLNLEVVEASIVEIKRQLGDSQVFGMNLLNNPDNEKMEIATVQLYLKHGVRFVEASAYIQMSAALVCYRLHDIHQVGDNIITPNRVLAKVSRPEVAEAFMKPAPENILQDLLAAGFITEEQARLGRKIPVAQDIVVEADSGGHTDMGNAYVLMPAIKSLCNRMMEEYQYSAALRIGAAGGIGTPESAVAAFMLGAEFIMTGSINQCTVESGASAPVKEILQTINVQDTDYAPAGDMFEIGAKVQVVRRGVFFPARANKLYDLYMKHSSIDELDERTQKQIQQKYFKRSFDEVWQETKAYYQKVHPHLLPEIEQNPKKKMAQIFRWYFIHTSRLALNGSTEQKVDYQIHCGPALGAFNQWIKGSEYEPWQSRHVATIGELIMTKAAEQTTEKLAGLMSWR